MLSTQVLCRPAHILSARRCHIPVSEKKTDVFAENVKCVYRVCFSVKNQIKELDAMRKDRVEYNNVVINNDTISLDKIEGRTIDMELVIRPEDKENVYKKFALHFAQNERFHTELCFRPDESVLKIDRKFSGSERALVHQRRCLVNGDANELKLRVILDRFSAEVFINDGEQVMSAVIFTEQEAKGISFFAEGAAKIDVVKYDLV